MVPVEASEKIGMQQSTISIQKEWWDITKIKIKQLAIMISKKISKENSVHLSKLEKI